MNDLYVKFVFSILFVLPFIGGIQILGSLIRYCLKGKPKAYYDNLRTYFKIVIIYLIGAIIINETYGIFEFGGKSELGIVLWNIYFILIPLIIAGYYLKIVYKKYEADTESNTTNLKS